MVHILIIDDEKPVRDVLKIALSEKGYALTEAADGEQGFEIFKETDPEIVITDVMMPKMTGIEVTRNIKKFNENADVIVMTGYGTEELVIEALRSGASNYIKKPIAFEDLFQILDNIIIKRQNRERSELSKDIVFFEQKDIVMGNDISSVWGTVNQILFNIHAGIELKIVEGLRIGLYEIIVNAIEHGNLGISYDDKSQALQNHHYTQLLKERMDKANREGKKIFIHCTYNRDKITVKIKDQGKGFNFKDLPDMNTSETIMSAHGRGIFLTSLYFDHLEYSEPGNNVQLVKNLQ